MNSHDHDKWEMNRMVTSGAMKMRDNTEVELENMESEQRVLLLVHVYNYHICQSELRRSVSDVRYVQPVVHSYIEYSVAF